MRTNKFKLLSVLLCLVLAIGMLSACGKKESKADTPTDGNNVSLSEVSAVDFVKIMGNGINLGNTLEAYGRQNYGTTAEVSLYETCWGQPVTTKEMISGMKEAGFDSIRIPVSWTNKMNFEDGDYTIDQSLVDRVKEVITYAVEADMYVIVNEHWDGNWWSMFGSETEDTRKKAEELYVSMWTQLSEAFADFDEHVIFEGANEQLGTALNELTAFCKDTGKLSDDDLYRVSNEINQLFVDTVRATGGNNATRFLMIVGYNTDIDGTIDDRFAIPTDSADKKILLDVHYYAPWNYVAEDLTESEDWGIKSEYEYMRTQLEKLQKFNEAGVGVVIGEYGAMPLKDGGSKNNVVEYTENFLNLCDMYGYGNCLWDRGDFYSKKDFKVVDEGLAKLFSERNYAKESEKDEATVIADAEAAVKAAEEAAPLEREKEEIDISDISGSTAWIMWNGGGYEYSVGDTYTPSSCSEGLVPTDVEITGAGEYTVALDFTGTEQGCSWGLTFSALGISNAEVLYPGAIADIKSIKINGEEVKLEANPYTSSDDELCTRVNLKNEWVNKLPDDARTVSGSLDGCDPVILSNDSVTQVKTIEITFDFVTAE